MNNVKISLQQQRAVNLRVAGLSDKEIAKAMSVSVMTIYNWFRSPKIKEYIDQFKKDAYDRGIELLNREFVKTIQKVVYLRDNAKTEATQLKSCALLLDQCKYYKLQEVQSMLDEVKELVETKVPK